MDSFSWAKRTLRDFNYCFAVPYLAYTCHVIHSCCFYSCVKFRLPAAYNRFLSLLFSQGSSADQQRAGEMLLSSPLSGVVLLSVARGEQGKAYTVLNRLSFTGLPFKWGVNWHQTSHQPCAPLFKVTPEYFEIFYPLPPFFFSSRRKSQRYLCPHRFCYNPHINEVIKSKD